MPLGLFQGRLSILNDILLTCFLELGSISSWLNVVAIIALPYRTTFLCIDLNQ
jgi:hypothetical protein